MALVPALAHAQASITGVVRDPSGAVLPGVTVEASSPALIEKVRSVVTDGSGQYRIIDLRPGTYAVMFTLSGFSTVRREGIELTGYVRRHDRRRPARRLARRDDHRHRREADRRRAAHDAAARLRPAGHRADPGRPQPHQHGGADPGPRGRAARTRRARRRRRHEQPAEHDVLDPRRPHERHAPSARRRPARQRPLGRRVLQLRARHRIDAGSRGRLRGDLGRAAVRRPAHQHHPARGRQQRPRRRVRDRRELGLAEQQPRPGSAEPRPARRRTR